MIEANASLGGLVRRNTETSYWDSVKGLAKEAGVDVNDPATGARFGRGRKDRKTSNREWCNPDDPNVKVGRTRDGAYDMIYKPEHTVDLETGAIIAAEARPGDAGDTADLSNRIIEEVELVEDMRSEDHVEGASPVRDVTADKGYHSPEELGIIQNETGARTVIGDAGAARRKPWSRGPSGGEEGRTRGEKQKRQSASQKARHAYRTGLRPCPGLRGPAAHGAAGLGQHQ